MRVHLVDGTYELFRAWFGAPPERAPSGQEVGAARSLARQLLRHVRDEGITHVGVAFDHVIESFRNELFDGYKTGEGLDPALLGQFELAEDVTRALGFVTWPMVEFEADDALATAAARFGSDPRVAQVRLLTPDKDLAQCVTSTRVVTVWKERLLDEEGVRARFGVAPASIPDFLALVGDARLGATLAERAAAARLDRTLATLRTDVPLAEDLAALEWHGANRGALAEVCERLGDSELMERVTQREQ